jgi:mandelate racemase
MPQANTPTQSSTNRQLHITGIRSRYVRVPMRFPLGTSAATVTEAPLLLVDLETKEGVVGRSYLFCYRDSGAKSIALILEEAAGLIQGQPVSPVDIAAFLARRYALLGVTGTVRMALAAIDIAAWDALAVAANMPLAQFLGAGLRDIKAYNSDGLGLMPAGKAAAEAVRLLEQGFTGVKLRLGHADASLDLHVATAVRRAVGPGVALMVDYNQALTVAETVARARALESLDIYWIEEPVRHAHYAGYAQLKASLQQPVQLGENFDGPEAVHDALSAGAADMVMLDAARIGGVTGWMRGVAIADAHGMEVSSHLFPEISIHLLAATPGAHWLEYVSWADAILQEPMVISQGNARPPQRPGLGLQWCPKGLAKYGVS